MLKTFKKYAIFPALAFIFGFWTFAGAQNLESFLNNSMGEKFFIELFPETPGPGEAVAARLIGASFNLDRAEIIWFHNGKIAKKGLGLKDYEFTAGKIGERESLRAEAITDVGQKYSASVSFVIAGIDFLWQADTSVPSWYKGKALPTIRSKINVTAFPHLVSGGREIAAERLIYRWSLDGNFIQQSSGSGKQNFSFQTSPAIGTRHSVELQVSNLNESVSAKKAINIELKKPLVLFYEEHPLEGTRMNSAFGELKTFLMAGGDKKSFKAEPFFFSLINGSPDLGESIDYSWTVDGEPAQKSRPFNTLNLSAEAGAAGEVSINLLVQHLSNILQQARAGFIINVQ